MSRKIFNIVLSIITILVVASCSKQEETKNIYYEEENFVTENNAKETSEENNMTIMDLFKSEERIWFFLENVGTAAVDLRYDTPVAAVMITKKGETTDLYYNFISENGDELNLPSNINPNPFSCVRYTLEDFNNLSDKEIIELVSKSYANAKNTYYFDFYEENQMLENCSFPYQIAYKGDLTDDGNSLSNESIKLFNHILGYKLYKYSNGYGGEYIPSEIKFASVISPTVIKDEEYVGIMYRGYSTDGDSYASVNDPDHALITKNTYKKFNDNIKLDSADKVTEW